MLLLQALIIPVKTRQAKDKLNETQLGFNKIYMKNYFEVQKLCITFKTKNLIKLIKIKIKIKICVFTKIIFKTKKYKQ